MVTRFYLQAVDTDTLALTPDAGWELITSILRYKMNTTKINKAFSTKGVAETSVSGVYDVIIAQFVSPPLAAQTITGTCKGIIRALESNLAADMQMQCSIRTLSQNGTVSGTLFALNSAVLTNEFDATTLTNRKVPLNWAGAGAALTSVTCVDWDRIIFEVGYRALNTVATSYTGSLEFGDGYATDLAENETDIIQKNPWLEFSQNLIFLDASAESSIYGQTDTSASSRNTPSAGSSSIQSQSWILGYESHIDGYSFESSIYGQTDTSSSINSIVSAGSSSIQSQSWILGTEVGKDGYTSEVGAYGLTNNANLEKNIQGAGYSIIQPKTWSIFSMTTIDLPSWAALNLGSSQGGNTGAAITVTYLMRGYNGANWIMWYSINGPLNNTPVGITNIAEITHF
jgi:hypothetical protein